MSYMAESSGTGLGVCPLLLSQGLWLSYLTLLNSDGLILTMGEMKPRLRVVCRKTHTVVNKSGAPRAPPSAYIAGVRHKVQSTRPVAEAQKSLT